MVKLWKGSLWLRVPFSAENPLIKTTVFQSKMVLARVFTKGVQFKQGRQPRRGAARERMCKKAINRQSDEQVEGACAVDTQRTCKESMSHSEVRQEQRDA